MMSHRDMSGKTSKLQGEHEHLTTLVYRAQAFFGSLSDVFTDHYHTTSALWPQFRFDIESGNGP
jgi:hypothetical protein